ncbi:phosphatase [Pseudoxanthomonas kalamensis DSM 18571]|uniref:acid phosphatase n=1 Tax=Pseudoxanthomonas kalamensis TaxID=289483 RepID=UPI00139163CC|nr:phosphatase PAP2 family protein [Pseudoxanthomonas kalamensis]KAF1712608.1 phosphatase [Pseudoxanthomonas kalamensis DSM 18571]
MSMPNSPSRFVLLSSLAAALLCACATAPAPLASGPRTDVPEAIPGFLAGYLDPAAVPSSLELLPPPPAPGTAALAHDEEVHRNVQALRGTPRWEQAAVDADLHFPGAASAFDCALGTAVTAEGTPRLYQVLQRLMADVGHYGTRSAKNHYLRPRPFMAHGETTCTPDNEAGLRKSGSYPSGHTAIGWASALVLAEASPDQAEAVLARGRSFGESRLVCNVHWQSDILQGRFVAASVVARLHANPQFTEDMAIARRELDTARTQGTPPARDCKAEAEALSVPIPDVL